uniref:Uncharacterized protein n=1 Tax=Strongyloides venezuelensis TaxID=75913 RepID=A0A0K0EUS5_STRVS
MSEDLIKLVHLWTSVRIYTYFDRHINNTYIENQSHPYQRIEDSHRAVSTVAKLVGYFLSTQGACGADCNITRIHISKKTESLLQNGVDKIWLGMENVNTRAGLMRYNEVYNNQTIDDKHIDRNIYCAFDSWGVRKLEDYKDNLPLVGDEESLKYKLPIAETTTPKVNDVVDC